MKYLILLFTCMGSVTYGQLTIDQAKQAVSKYAFSYYSYHQVYEGHAGYAAPVILTADSGAVVFGAAHGELAAAGLLVKLNKSGKEEWTKRFAPQFDEIEVQSVVQDKAGNYYVFMLSYNYDKYRGGSERVAYLNQRGEVMWDKLMGDHEQANSPHFSCIRALEDGRINLRGHIVLDKPENEDDAVYYKWEGWLNSMGALTQKVWEVETEDNWQEWLKVE